ncbi:sulfur carrier protein ThiS [Pedobacter frigoris]|uniref:sulfur carrier protein ThiS n=1 Tax=Pedobacter frigoris TaxID=2571272 RepID=UPI00292FFED6|nr:sulfur carrier protein ThiS [Pedobacter frigoris]
MKVTVNHKNYVLDDACSVEQMLSVVLQKEAKGIAVAINQSIISKPHWSAQLLKEGDQILLIKATQGG